MSAFSEAELAYLQDERRLDPIATVGPDGRPHVGPVGMWRFNLELDTRRRATTPGILGPAAREAIPIQEMSSISLLRRQDPHGRSA
jgi:hypothetical protein